MTIKLSIDQTWKTSHLLGVILSQLQQKDARVQFLLRAGTGVKVVQRLRVCLSRSRERNRRQGRKVQEFTLRHESYKHTDEQGIRHDAIVMWIERRQMHVSRELLDDIVERDY